MSYQLALDTIHLRPTPRLGHTEYCSHDPLRRQITAQTGLSLEDAWQLDLIWATDDGPTPWDKRGRTTDMGHADFLEGGTDRREPKPSPFTSPEQVWAFDAVQEYGLPDFDALVTYYEAWYQKLRKLCPNQLVTGGYYKTIISGAIEAFGWDALLEAAADQSKFETVLDSIFRLTHHHFKAWAKTSCPVLICHDDFVWTGGPFVHPDFYRRAVFPRYAQLWKTVHAAGKKLLFCSDGNFTPFIDDLIAAGADGLIFEPTTDLDYICQRYGQSHAIVGSHVDCRTLTFGTPADIQREIDATLKLAKKCPGFIFAVGNHIPANIPLPNALFYYDYLSKHWTR